MIAHHVWKPEHECFIQASRLFPVSCRLPTILFWQFLEKNLTQILANQQ